MVDSIVSGPSDGKRKSSDRIFGRNGQAEPINKVGSAFYELNYTDRAVIVAEQRRLITEGDDRV